MTTRHTVVMVTTSYPRFPGDTYGTFMEPIARGVASLGHGVHLVAPWHPGMRRPREEHGVQFHFFRYAPLSRLYVFGYAGALKADVSLRTSAYAVAPFALTSGWATARAVRRRVGATVVHGHWVIPGGVIGAAAAGSTPLLVSVHGSDLYVAERHALARRAAAWAFRRAGWVTACSADLLARAVAMGAPTDRSEVVPYGVDADRFRPDHERRAACRSRLGVGEDAPLLFSAGRFVRKKGFEYLLEAVARLADRWPTLTLVMAGDGDLADELREQAVRLGIAGRLRFVGTVGQHEVAEYLAAADVSVVPSVRDAAGNVDGLPNVVMESMASGTPLVTTAAGGIGAVAEADHTALVVPEHDAEALSAAIHRLLASPAERRRLGAAARSQALARYTWSGVARRFVSIYDRLGCRAGSVRSPDANAGGGRRETGDVAES